MGACIRGEDIAACVSLPVVPFVGDDAVLTWVQSRYKCVVVRKCLARIGSFHELWIRTTLAQLQIRRQKVLAFEIRLPKAVSGDKNCCAFKSDIRTLKIFFCDALGIWKAFLGIAGCLVVCTAILACQAVVVAPALELANPGLRSRLRVHRQGSKSVWRFRLY